MASLPVDLIVHILSRVPVKDLVRFRCTCKSWNSMLRSPSFVRIHLDHWSKVQGVDIYSYDDDGITQLMMFDPEKSQHSDLDLPIDRHKGMSMEVIGSSNGVLCLYARNHDIGNHESKIFIWNPFINEFALLPTPASNVASSIGFGWDDTSRDDLGEFKVVNIHKLGRRSSEVEVEMFSQRRNSWSRLENTFPSACSLHHLGRQVIFETFICWCHCICLDNVMKSCLVLFDVSKEKFHEEELPDTMPPENKYIALLDGCLSLICHSCGPKPEGYEVWSMNKFGDINSWTKLYTISVWCNPRHKPIGFTSSGNVMFMGKFYIGLRWKSPSYLEVYDRAREKFDSFRRNSEKVSFSNSRWVNHVGSLVSPLAFK